MLHIVLDVLLYALPCLAPALILLPVRVLDREPENEIVHEQPGGGEQEPDGLLAAA